jgi:hypothetical protein
VGTLGEDEVLSGGGGGRSEELESLGSSEPEDAGEDDSADEPEGDSSFVLLSELDGWSLVGTEPPSSGSLSWDVSKSSASSASLFLFSQRGLKTGCVGAGNARADDEEKCLYASCIHSLWYSTVLCFIFVGAARDVSWLNALRNSQKVEFAACDERERVIIRTAPRAAMVTQSMSSSASRGMSMEGTEKMKVQSERESATQLGTGLWATQAPDEHAITRIHHNK